MTLIGIAALGLLAVVVFGAQAIRKVLKVFAIGIGPLVAAMLLFLVIGTMLDHYHYFDRAPDRAVLAAAVAGCQPGQTCMKTTRQSCRPRSTPA